MRRLIHISDLHFGRIQDFLVQNLIQDIVAAQPDLVIVSGDLTQRARTSQFQEACRFLKNLPFAKLVVPGNHDIPLWNLYRRFAKPLSRYQRYITENLSPSFEDKEISVQGINTAHGRTLAGGHFLQEDLQRILNHWSQLDPRILKVLVSHHPFEGLTHPQRNRRWGYRIHHPEEMALTEQADLILSGHFHHSDAFLTEQVFLTPHRSIVAIQAGTATSSRLREEMNSYNLIETANGEVHFEKRIWREDSGRFIAETDRKFYLRHQGWKTSSVEPQFL
ncbi:MAG: metallophosphoesterase [Pseudobdellovibrionaceae bacterium]